MNVKVQNINLKSKTLNLFHGKVQNNILAIPNQALNLIRDLRISASHLSFGFDLKFIIYSPLFVTSCDLRHSG